MAAKHERIHIIRRFLYLETIYWQDAPKYTQGNSNISFIDGGQTFDDMISISNNADKTSFDFFLPG
ncbi:MAG: hypothetical protein P0116_09670 [Candidatus Nitrosocosmicus sp.]|nr:hypothetical protein [Candidatus Nitrosocosmicus sp.]